MGSKEVLKETEIKRLMADLPEWTKNGKALRRTVDFKEYLEAIDFVHIIAEIAEQFNHHPDIEIRHTKVTLYCTTHRAKGITERDIELAHKIEQLIQEAFVMEEECEEEFE